jgi:nucleoside phosphorylase
MAEFSTLLNSVKPRDRTDQHKILAALYFLNSRSAPVTAKEIRELLALHLGKNIPKNISDRLRKYSSYVEVAEKGPPLRWSITETGLEYLRASTKLDLRPTGGESDFQTDVAFICALQEPEFESLLNALGGQSQWEDAGNTRFSHLYLGTELVTESGKHLKVVGTTSTSMGLTAAAIATTHLILQFKPRIVIMVGIAAGTRSGGKEFGDVLIADPSVDYNSGKVALENGIREFLPDPYPIGLNARLRSVLQKYRSKPEVFQSIRARWTGELPGSQNRVHIGPLGAADQVIDDSTRVLEIQRNWRKLIGVEMETYAVYRACHEAPDPKPRFASFKSVCDFAAEKTDSWQNYASYTAAEFAVGFLKSEWDALWPKF